MRKVDIRLWFDGGCERNPGGPMSFGWVARLADSGELLGECGGPVEGYPVAESTNNTAEFHGLLAGLEWVSAFRLFPVNSLSVCGDSQLVVKIVNGDWQCHQGHLRPLAEPCRAELAALRKRIGSVKLTWVPREQNRETDRIAAGKKDFFKSWEQVIKST